MTISAHLPTDRCLGALGKRQTANHRAILAVLQVAGDECERWEEEARNERSAQSTDAATVSPIATGGIRQTDVLCLHQRKSIPAHHI